MRIVIITSRLSFCALREVSFFESTAPSVTIQTCFAFVGHLTEVRLTYFLFRKGCAIFSFPFLLFFFWNTLRDQTLWSRDPRLHLSLCFLPLGSYLLLIKLLMIIHKIMINNHILTAFCSNSSVLEERGCNITAVLPNWMTQSWEFLARRWEIAKHTLIDFWKSISLTEPEPSTNWKIIIIINLQKKKKLKCYCQKDGVVIHTTMMSRFPLLVLPLARNCFSIKVDIDNE